MRKLSAMEAVRGLAAVSVVVCHLLTAFAPECGVGPTAGPWQSLYDGVFAVKVFFVLSGFVLSLAYFRRRDPGALASAAARRYFRLMPPVLASVLVAYSVMAGGFMNNSAAAAALGQPPTDWFGKFFLFEPNLGDAVREGVWRSLFDRVAQQKYNPVLWTLAIEFQGSLLVFAFLALFGNLRNRWLVYLIAGKALIDERGYWVAFLAGIALADWHVNVRQEGRGRGGWPAWLGGAVAVPGVLVAGTHAEWLPDGWWFDDHGRTAGAAMVVAAVAATPVLQRLLERPALVTLGAWSFSLYLFHWSVLFSAGAATFLALDAGAGRFAAVSAAVVVTLALSFAAAWAGTVTVDRGSVALAKWVDDLVFRRGGAGELGWHWMLPKWAARLGVPVKGA